MQLFSSWPALNQNDALTSMRTIAELLCTIFLHIFSITFLLQQKLSQICHYAWTSKTTAELCWRHAAAVFFLVYIAALQCDCVCVGDFTLPFYNTGSVTSVTVCVGGTSLCLFTTLDLWPVWLCVCGGLHSACLQHWICDQCDCVCGGDFTLPVYNTGSVTSVTVCVWGTSLCLFTTLDLSLLPYSWLSVFFVLLKIMHTIFANYAHHFFHFVSPIFY